MKKLVFLLTFSLAAFPAFAELGDTYAQSYNRFGGPGMPYKGLMCWKLSNGCTALELFRNNRCIAIGYRPDTGRRILEGEVWRSLQGNSPSLSAWTQLGSDSKGTLFGTTDGSIYGKLFNDDGSLWICFRSFLGNRTQPSHRAQSSHRARPIRPPVEDDDSKTNI
jgi:hypothetical protein